ncbi:MAG: sulfotransferase [Maricaulaceae bacterium]
MHPLSGADWSTFTKVLQDAAPIDPRKLPAVLGAAAAILARAPFSALERAWLTGKLTPVERLAPPLVILGHWRSGTTHLYNILGQAAFAYTPPVATGLPWNFLRLGVWLKSWLDKSLPKHRWIDNVAVTPDAPQEDEIALANMVPTSFYHGIYFPHDLAARVRREVFFDDVPADEVTAWDQAFLYFHQKIDFAFGGRPLLIKNPVYTARLAHIRGLLPQAKFVHIRRNPYKVFVSMRNFYEKLLPPLALQPYDHVDIDALVLDIYREMMTRYDAQSADLGDNTLLELAYEDLDADPIPELARLYDQLDLGDFDKARPNFERYLSAVKSYQKNQFTLDRGTADRIEAQWGPWIERWGYSRPASA